MLQKEVKYIDNDKLKKWALDQVMQLAKDYNQTIVAADIQHIASRFYSEMKIRGHWRLGEFKHMLECGVSGVFKNSNSASKITVAKLLQWLFEFTQTRSNKHAAQSVQQANEFKFSATNSVSGMVMAQLYALAEKGYYKEVEITRGVLKRSNDPKQPARIVGSHFVAIRNHVQNGGTVEGYLKQIRAIEKKKTYTHEEA